tara:strand:+ start:338439 stop:339395 length:957 start_codon:yes stop_codon:yes gene_type:complete
MSWRPTASIALLRQRAALLRELRAFFQHRDILEVETPLLCRAGITDPAIEPLSVSAGVSVGAAPRYLQTSPEYAMKRLLAADSGAIYQISKAFRDGEAGKRHNPEFTLLEWYRPGFDHHALMTEVAQLIRSCLGPLPEARLRYQDLFQQELDIDPLRATAAELERLARLHLDPGTLRGDRDLWLDLLMSHVLEPRLSGRGVCFVYDYPASQAALARIVNEGGQPVAQRFEVYVHGVELANGYHELTDAVTQRQRLEQDNATRASRGLPQYPIDEMLLAALASGLPACSGVAMGLDRLLMLAAGCSDIREIMSFDWASA